MYVTQMVYMIKHIIGAALLIKRVWSFSGILQQIEVLAHIMCQSLGSNYPKTVELFPPKLNAYKLILVMSLD